jgi:hypothetical protein
MKATHQKNFFTRFNYYNLTIREVTLTEIFSTKYQHIEVENFTVGSRKTSFHFDHWPTCQEVHISGPIFTKTALKF